MHRTATIGLAPLFALAAVPSLAQNPTGAPGRPPGGFGQGGPPNSGNFAPMIPPMPMMGAQTPELAKKMAAIAALREIQNLRMTGRDITTVVPLLKELREAEKTLEARAGEVLEQERRALLAAGPETQVPPTSGERLREANDQYRAQSQRVWQSIFQKAGPHIGSGLQRLLQGNMFPPMGPGPGIPGGFGGGQGFGPGPGAPGFPPPGADVPHGQPGRPGQGEVGPPPGFPPQPGQPGGFGQNRPRGQGRPGGQDPFRNVPGAPTGQGVNPPTPGQGPPGAPGFGRPAPMTGAGPMMGGARISLAELIELLEQKRAAMRS